MSYKGDIIEESLADKATLQDVHIIATRIETVTPDHKTPWLKQWTLHTIEVPEDEAATVAEKLSHAIETEHKSWYIDFKDDTTHFVIFPGKVFKVDRSTPENTNLSLVTAQSWYPKASVRLFARYYVLGAVRI